MNSSEQNKLEHIIRRMAADRSEDAPADAIRYASNLFRSRATQARPSVLRKVLAALHVDLAPNKAAFGERSASGVQARQMLFDAGDNAIDLRVNVEGQKFHIRGQVLGSGIDGGEVELSHDGINVRAKIDENGGFTFAGLTAGEYSLTIQSSETELVIEKFTL
jgi:hypothetical protein